MAAGRFMGFAGPPTGAQRTTPGMPGGVPGPTPPDTMGGLGGLGGYPATRPPPGMPGGVPGPTPISGPGVGGPGFVPSPSPIMNPMLYAGMGTDNPGQDRGRVPYAGPNLSGQYPGMDTGGAINPNGIAGGNTGMDTSPNTYVPPKLPPQGQPYGGPQGMGAPLGGFPIQAPENNISLLSPTSGTGTPSDLGSLPNLFSPGQPNAPTNPNYKGPNLQGSPGAGMGKYFPGSVTGANGAMILGPKYAGKFDYASWKADQDAKTAAYKAANPQTATGATLPGTTSGPANPYGTPEAFLAAKQGLNAFQASLAGKTPAELQQMWTQLQAQAGAGFSANNPQGADLTTMLGMIYSAMKMPTPEEQAHQRMVDMGMTPPPIQSGPKGF